MIRSAENEVAELAREAAKADAMARAAKKAELGQAQQLELQRLKVGPVCGWVVMAVVGGVQMGVQKGERGMWAGGCEGKMWP
jgi:hypothetical protein